MMQSLLGVVVTTVPWGSDRKPGWSEGGRQRKHFLRDYRVWSIQVAPKPHVVLQVSSLHQVSHVLSMSELALTILRFRICKSQPHLS